MRDAFPPVRRRFIMYPLSMGQGETSVVHTLALATAAVRGVDYLFPAEAPASALGLIERAAPLWVWGALFIVGAVIVVVGLLADSLPSVFLGHVGLASLYAAIGFGQFAYRYPDHGFVGIRTAFGLAVGAAGIHLVLSWVAWTQFKNGRAARHAAGIE